MRILFVLLLLTPSLAFAQHSQLIPDSATAVFSISDYETWRAQIPETSIGRFFRDGHVKAIHTSLTEAARRRPGIQSFLDAKIIRKYCCNQCTVSLLPVGNRMEVCVLISCENRDFAQQCRQDLDKMFGAQVSSKQLDADVVFSSSPAAVARFGVQGKMISNTRGFRQSVQRALQDLPDATFWAFYDPVAVGRFRSQNRQPNGSKVNAFEVLQKEGLGAVSGIGVCGTLKSNAQPTRLRGYIGADFPFEKGMRLLDLSNQAELRLAHVFGGTNSRGKFCIDWNNALRNFSTVFDQVVGDGEQGIFRVVIDELKNAEDGPKLDMQKDFLALLTGPLMFGEISLGGRQHFVTAVKTTSMANMLETVTRFYTDDPSVKKIERANFAAWAVSPMTATGPNKRSYVVAVHKDHFWLAANYEAIEAVLSNRSAGDNPNLAARNACLFYELDFRKMANLRFNELGNGAPGGFLGSIFAAADLNQSVSGVDKTSWPTADVINNHFGSKLKIIGRKVDGGFQLDGEIR